MPDVVGAILLAHLVGDYLIQSHWMAQEKVHRWWPAVVHGVTYTIPFVLITQSPGALAVIGGTHIVIDRYRLAKYFVWARNWLAPVRISRGTSSLLMVESYNPPWRECRATGMPSGSPAYLAVWLLFIADNTLHCLINLASVVWL